ncbi:hypothetical protein D4764_05G0000840 [Takifugu flavidus]|uniref:Uncharacterized protein n=1 Tax=Takifugu flavidus TaxID=433684 RepID=A0A5C6MXD8_9TELE|nr:hypothetical protein D4764_05G0000840 [Takifugu flavidus]
MGIYGRETPCCGPFGEREATPEWARYSNQAVKQVYHFGPSGYTTKMQVIPSIRVLRSCFPATSTLNSPEVGSCGGGVIGQKPAGRAASPALSWSFSPCLYTRLRAPEAM